MNYLVEHDFPTTNAQYCTELGTSHIPQMDYF